MSLKSICICKMDSSIKSLTITGAAAESIAVKAARRSLAVSRKKRKDQVSEDDDFIEQIKQHNIISKQEITPKQLQIHLHLHLHRYLHLRLHNYLRFQYYPHNQIHYRQVICNMFPKVYMLS